MFVISTISQDRQETVFCMVRYPANETLTINNLVRTKRRVTKSQSKFSNRVCRYTHATFLSDLFIREIEIPSCCKDRFTTSNLCAIKFKSNSFFVNFHHGLKLCDQCIHPYFSTGVVTSYTKFQIKSLLEFFCI